jgi:hypothetical protein
VITALSLLLWFQGNILVWKYGPLDGREIIWNTYWLYGVIDTSIWVLVLIFAVKKRSILLRWAQPITTFLIVVQIIAITVTYYQMPKDFWDFKHYLIDDNPKFIFSKEKNVIVMVLDEFQSNIFQDIISENDRYGNVFNGFTYFRNAVAPFSGTELSIPAILTGKFYDNSIKRNTFLKNAFSDHSIPKILKENGFEVDLFPLRNWEHHSLYFDESLCSNLKNNSDYKVQLKEMLLLIDLSLFRDLPYFFKKYIYSHNHWFLSRLLPAYYKIGEYKIRTLKNKIYEGKEEKVPEMPVYEFEGDEFIKSAIAKAQFQKKNGVFKFYHLWGMHIPLRINEKSEFVSQVTYNKENYTRQAKAYLGMCKLFFDMLKQAGAYDHCLIFVLGDHGSGRSEDMYINPASDSRKDILNEASPHHDFQGDKARGIPLLLAKPFNSTGSLRISDAPVSLTDIPKTIISETGIAKEFPGLSLFAVKDNDNRKRYYGAFKWVADHNDFMTPITMYVVSGFSWANESWDVVSILPPKE